jgi:homogentisate 1,2-dioxygenase
MTTPSRKRTRADDQLSYHSGFGNYVSSEALPGALPSPHNTPQVCPYGLYAELLSGTSFTKVRHASKKVWMYRIFPSASHGSWTKLDQAHYKMCLQPCVTTPEQRRWKPMPMPTTATTFVEGLTCYCGAGDPKAKGGLRIHLYACNRSMVDSSFCNSDGDFLFVPEHGTLTLKTEMGVLVVPSGHIAVVQRGIKFAVEVPETGARGYVCEVFDGNFELPPMGVIGTNGLANNRDFEMPVAAFEDKSCKWTCFQKFGGELWSYPQEHSPFDVVAWHGNYVPYRYDLAKFCVINSVSYDHLDPSIFCVVTAQTAEPGVATCDFVIFPPRWMVQEKTFRPPYYHRNTMTEFMGNIRGVYEAKEEGFLPGGATLHSCMAAHGPETQVFEKASTCTLEPQPPKNDALAFMFETTYIMQLTSYAASENVDANYQKCWGGFKKHFKA